MMNSVVKRENNVWWLLLILPAAWVGKKIYDACQQEAPLPSASTHTPPQPLRFEERGDLAGPKVLVIGRTGAGKSSLINMLSGRSSLATGPVTSTTRWVEGVRVKLADREILLVDTPGYGEVHTANDYYERLVNYVKDQRGSIRMILLVLQADAKAYADDYRIFCQVLGVRPGIPVIVIVNQVDKLMPIRQPLESDSWSIERMNNTLKSYHIAEKIEEVSRQFELKRDRIEPSVSVDGGFNRNRLLALISEHLS
jgi:small GTP-binding protein